MRKTLIYGVATAGMLTVLMQGCNDLTNKPIEGLYGPAPVELETEGSTTEEVIIDGNDLADSVDESNDGNEDDLLIYTLYGPKVGD